MENIWLLHMKKGSCLIPSMQCFTHGRNTLKLKKPSHSQQHSMQNGKHLSIIWEEQGGKRFFFFSFYFLSCAGVLCLFFDSLKEGICLINLFWNNYNLHILSYFSSLWVEVKWENRCLSCYETHKEIPFVHWSTLIRRFARDVKPYSKCIVETMLFYCFLVVYEWTENRNHFFFYCIFLFLPPS